MALDRSMPQSREIKIHDVWEALTSEFLLSVSDSSSDHLFFKALDVEDVDNDMDIFEMMCSLQDGDEVEVFVNHLVDEPDVVPPPPPKPLFLENICPRDLEESGASFNARPNFRVGEDHLNVEDPTSFFPTTSPFNITPLFTAASSAAALSVAAPNVAATTDAAVDDIDIDPVGFNFLEEKVEASDYSTEDSVESEGELDGDDDEEEYGSDVHEGRGNDREKAAPLKRSKVMGMSVFQAENGFKVLNPVMPSNKIYSTGQARVTRSADIAGNISYTPSTINKLK
ncbi:hypothetical protein T459_29473 [Capsicum annuum]|uniref:Uncharacterized protein n=1 Tax=Capsicum annuum TaxID=4072 RepID=A0A2G2Y5N9_CAPAN|nr:hypothetical protein T459_29473 [Capsicum annuum]